MTASPTDAATFRDAMAVLASAVTIITTDGARGRHGMTASAVSSVSDAPPTLLVCVNRDATAHPHILAHGRLAVNILSHDQTALSNRFADKRLSMEARFAEGRWRRGDHGMPILDDALATLECRVAETREIGTHTVVFATVDEILRPSATGGQALVWVRRGYVAA